MSDCARYQEELSLLLDGELPEGRRAALELHLASCAHCQETLAAFSALSGLLTPEEPPAELRLHQRVMERIAAAPPPTWKDPGILEYPKDRKRRKAQILHLKRRWLPMAACFLLLSGLALGVARGNRLFHGLGGASPAAAPETASSTTAAAGHTQSLAEEPEEATSEEAALDEERLDETPRPMYATSAGPFSAAPPAEEPMCVGDETVPASGRSSEPPAVDVLPWTGAATSEQDPGAIVPEAEERTGPMVEEFAALEATEEDTMAKVPEMGDMGAEIEVEVEVEVEAKVLEASAQGLLAMVLRDPAERLAPGETLQILLSTGPVPQPGERVRLRIATLTEADGLLQAEATLAGRDETPPEAE